MQTETEIIEANFENSRTSNSTPASLVQKNLSNFNFEIGSKSNKTFALPRHVRAKKSIIWSFFDKHKEDPNMAKCNLCPTIVSACGNTSNCMKHLRLNHSKDLRKEEKRRNKEPVDESTTSSSEIDEPSKGRDETETEVAEVLPTNTNGNEMNENGGTSKGKKEIQLSIRKVLKKRPSGGRVRVVRPYRRTSDRQKLLDKRLIEMIAKDFQPFSIVNDEGFVTLVRELDPRYNIPARQTLRYSILPSYYNECETRLQNILNNVTYVAITFDAWTCVNNRGYIAVTGHFLLNWELKACLLSFIELSDSHTANNTVEAIRARLNLYPNIKITCAVTDNANTMSAAVRMLNFNHLPCYLHTVQLVVKHAVLDSSNVKADLFKNDCFEGETPEEVENILSNGNSIASIIHKCRAIAKHFHYRVAATNKLREELKKHKMSVTNVITAVDTRWNSLYFMLERIDSIMDPILAVLCRDPKRPDLLTPEEMIDLKDILKLLKPFADVTNDLNGEKYCTISLIIPYTKAIFTELSDIIIESPNPSCQLLKKKLLEQTKSRLFWYESNLLCSMASVLDPRVKEPGFNSNTNYMEAVKTINQEMKNRISRKLAEINHTSSNDTSSQLKKSSMPNLLKGVLGKARPKNHVEAVHSKTEAISKFNTYLAEDALPFETDIFQYWKNYPLSVLSEVAGKFLIVPAASTPSERTFSAAEYTVTKRRNRLAPEVTEKLIFLNKNFHLFRPDELATIISEE